MTLSGEGEYNLNSLKEIAVTDPFLELDTEVIKCQSYNNNGTYDDCMTRYFLREMKMKCGCLPLAVSIATKGEKKVCTNLGVHSFHLLFEISFCSTKKEKACIGTIIQESTRTECLRYINVILGV